MEETLPYSAARQREQESCELLEVEMHRCRNNFRKFYQKFKRLNESYKHGASSCTDGNENLVKDSQGMLKL